MENNGLRKDVTTQIEKLQKAGKLQQYKLMGMGRPADILMINRLLNHYGLKLTEILDNDAQKAGGYLDGIPVNLPEKALLPVQKDILILLYSPKYWKEILEQLKGLGYTSENIIHLAPTSFRSNIKKISDGRMLYQKIKSIYGSNPFIFVIRGPLGDFYLASLFLKQYCQEHHIKEYVWVGDSKGFKSLKDLLQIQNAYILTPDETDALLWAYAFWGNKHINIKVLDIWQMPFRVHACRTRFLPQMNFMDTFRSFIYGLPVTAKPCFPIFHELTDELITKFKQMGFPRGKTVILSPFAYSIKTPPLKFWQKLADQLIAKGFSVAVNVDISRESNPLKGTKAWMFSFEDGEAALAYAGNFIAVRSGLCDITARARCKKIILYPEKPRETKISKIHSASLSFNSLNAMGLCHDAVELEYGESEIELDKLIDHILAGITKMY